ncbi:hypothetical protein [Mucilaginibacter polytrichastri]|uniref:Uncharacterized protein n=1 Tax=Mucilaginibacter polytrichastri TaxID=1302689 RepID=A0A1Q5ZZB2_9SPHI|nr:hypothetical protein [Mucilaginibacter polytrichastri]OKS87082.1 hypothetical protein RG47T_2541 [Mucilaginibacter polytrichastri]SFS87141.1 hypothetical protein SAMN04487890_105150 [Mucilaginibacter polytrichastri]
MINTLSFISLLCHLWLQHPTHVKNKSLYKTPKALFELQNRHKDYYDDCVFTKRYSISQRLKKYPFVEASKIVVVSYHAEEPEPNIYIGKDGKRFNPDSVRIQLPTGLHIKEGKIDTRTLTEFIALNEQQINALTNIIFNTDYRLKDEIAGFSQGTCFEPRNALIFLDRNGKVFDYIEICFECQNAKSLSQRIGIGTLCNQKYDILKKYFISLGIKTGTLQN